MLEDTTLLTLRQQGYRLTPQRLTILRILHEAGGHRTPVEIFRLAQTELPGLTEATVYRSLNFLVENNLATVTHQGGGQLAYEIAGHAHHHLTCRACGANLEIDHELLTALFQEIHTQTGFLIDHQHISFTGLCPACQDDPTTTP
jgi:Fe2+ or Zn2+ uptake regulation protein